MNIAHFLQESVLQIITGVATAGVIAGITLLLPKLKSRRKSGIQRIYPRSIEIRGMKRAIENADELSVIAVAARCFMAGHSDTIERRLQENPDFRMRIILVDPKSPFHDDHNDAAGNEHGFSQGVVESTLSILATIGKRSGDPLKPFFEARFCRTECRNQIVMCKRRDRGENSIQAWIAVSMPSERDKLRFSQFPTLEMDSEKSKMCYQHFEMLWNKYDPSILKTTATLK